MPNSASIQTKILLSIASVFLLLMSVSLYFMVDRQKQMVHVLAADKARDIAHSYFDGLNAMMLSGSISKSDLLREKILSHEDVKDARLIRAKPIIDNFGAGHDNQPTDDLDRAGLAGKAQSKQISTADGENIIIVEPIVASSNFKGTNCLSCHAVSEGTVLGAVRVSYCLTNLHNKINQDLSVAGSIAAGVFIGGR